MRWALFLYILVSAFLGIIGYGLLLGALSWVIAQVFIEFIIWGFAL